MDKLNALVEKLLIQYKEGTIDIAEIFYKLKEIDKMRIKEVIKKVNLN